MKLSLKEYSESKGYVASEIAGYINSLQDKKKKAFYDRYVETGEMEDGSDTFLQPYAKMQLDKDYKPGEIDTSPVSRGGSINFSIPKIDTPPVKASATSPEPQKERRRRTARQQGVAMDPGDKETKVKEKKMENEFMNAPMSEAEADKKPEGAKKRQPRTESAKAEAYVQKKRKARNATPKNYFKNLDAEEKVSGDVKDIRKSLLASGMKAEDVACLTDDEAMQAFGKEYLIIGFMGKKAIVKRSALDSIRDDITLIEE